MIKQQNKKGSVRSRIKRGDEVVFIAGKEFNRYEKERTGRPSEFLTEARLSRSIRGPARSRLKVR